MRSKASFKSHPIHPILIPFPIAFLVGGFACNVIGWLFGAPGLWTAGAWLTLAGIITGLAAAVPGIIDYLYTIPPESSAKKRATWHMLVNFAAVGAFLIAWIVRGFSPTVEPNLLILMLELAGVAALGGGGWLGGTLVYRNLIGVDHRYAQTGKWSEASFDIEAAKISDGSTTLDVGKDDELDVNQMKLLRIAASANGQKKNEKRIVLARTENGYVAFDDHCTHRGGSLAGGVLMCGRVQCLWHGSQFDVASGEVRCGPAQKPIGTYHVEQRDGRVVVTL